MSVTCLPDDGEIKQMSSITIVNGSFCNLNEVVQQILTQGSWEPVHTQAVIKDAAERSGMSEAKLASVFYSKSSLLERLTHDKDLATAWLKLSIAHQLQKQGLIITGPAALLVPATIGHVLRVCLISSLGARIKVAGDQEQINEADARRKIESYDADLSQWSSRVADSIDPWDPQLYDMLLPMDTLAPDEAASQIVGRINSEMLKVTAESKEKARDFLLEAEVGAALAKKGHHMTLSSEKGRIIITVNEHTLMFNHLAEEMTRISKEVPGVLSVSVLRGEGFHKADIYRQHDFKMPTKVLLVDDERKFAKTLSDRLIMRDLGASVAYDGPSALEMIEREKPEVMVLDLKMPGMDGIEVLKIVREKHPEIAVIILTGHGSEVDRQICLSLGAVDYLKKPVKIDVLSDVLKKAAENIRTAGA